MGLTLLHVGCANRYYEGFINSDLRDGWGDKKYKLDMLMDLSKPWPYENESVDGIVSMQVMIQLQWRDLIVAFREAYRVLKKGGVMRMGLPMVEFEDQSLERLLGWNNINLFSYDLIKRVLVDRIGFASIRKCDYHDSALPELTRADNRRNRGTMYVEVIK